MFKLRPYQASALELLRDGFRRRIKRQMLYLPTGGGKTIAAEGMIRGALDRGLRVAFVCNRVHLVEQASKHFTRNGIAHGIVQGNNTRDPMSQVLVCSIQTVARRGLPPDLGLIVIDEAHGTPGSVDYRRFVAQRNAVSMVGLSATPFARGMAKTFPEIGGPLWQEMVVGSSIRELIDQGFLVDLDIYVPATPDLSDVPIIAGDYHEKKLGEAVDKPTLIGDIVSNWFKYASNRQTVVFATNITHSQHIVETFKQAGIIAAHIDCYTPEEIRIAILAAFERGEITVLSNVAILSEGWDCPSCEVMILARPTRSLIRYIQMAGRVLRPFDGKDRALILDHSGSAARLGYPTDDLPLVLDSGGPRKATRDEPEEKPEFVECPSCHFLKPRMQHACPRCGFAPQKRDGVRQGDGELIRLNRHGKTINVPEREMRQFLGELTGYADSKGYKRGWAFHQFEEKYGVFPKDVGICWADPKPLTELGRGWITHMHIRRRHSHARS